MLGFNTPIVTIKYSRFRFGTRTDCFLKAKEKLGERNYLGTVDTA